MVTPESQRGVQPRATAPLTATTEIAPRDVACGLTDDARASRGDRLVQVEVARASVSSRRRASPRPPLVTEGRDSNDGLRSKLKDAFETDRLRVPNGRPQRSSCLEGGDGGVLAVARPRKEGEQLAAPPSGARVAPRRRPRRCREADYYRHPWQQRIRRGSRPDSPPRRRQLHADACSAVPT